MSLIFNGQKRENKAISSFAVRMFYDNGGFVITTPILIALLIISLLGGGLLGIILGKGFAFKIGLAVGLCLVFFIPNLDRIIRWYKSVKGEVKSDE